MTALTATAPASPGSALKRMLLGPELTAAERVLIRTVLERAPRLPAVHLPRSVARRVLRRVGIVAGIVAGVLGLNMITAPQAQAFSIFGPVKHALETHRGRGCAMSRRTCRSGSAIAST